MEPLYFSRVSFISILTYLILPVIAQSNTTSVSPSPTSVPGNTNYDLLGCYNELPPNSSDIALGATGTYMSPLFSSSNALTVPLCLEGCGVASTANRAGRYIYAAVENSRQCYCGLTLSPESHPVPENNCNLLCPADPTTICGGNDFLTLYKARFPMNDTITSPTPVPTPTTSIIPIPAPSHKYTLNMTPIWIGISLGLLALALLVISLLNLESRLHTSRTRAELISSIPPHSFIGGYKLNDTRICNRMSRNPFHDGRRFGVVGLGVDGEVGVERLWDTQAVIQSEEEGRRNRDTFEAWKKGVVPSLKSEWEDRTVGNGGWHEAGLYDGGSQTGSDMETDRSAPGLAAWGEERRPL